jgi:hypothetical protein
MNDERYRLQEVLREWKSHRDLDKSLMKAAVGEVSRVPTRKAHLAILSLFVVVWYAILRLLIYRSVLFRVLLLFNCRVGFLQGAKLINLQREGPDPDPILLSYIPALDVI